jgi:hypothetical protein
MERSMADKKPACPHCGQSDQVIKVNQIYIESISNQAVTDATTLPRVLNWPSSKPASSPRSLGERQFLNLFYPPSSKPTLIRSVHPDGVVVIFSLFALFLFYQIYTTQPEFIFLALGAFLAFLVFYLVSRKRIVARYQKTINEEAGQQKNIEAAVGKWMRMYYCIRDASAFDPTRKQMIPIEELKNYLLEKE